MKQYIASLIAAAVLLFAGIAFAAVPVTQVVNGGTGSSTLTGILIGAAKLPIKTLTIGFGLTLTGTTLAATGGGGSGSGSVGTSTVDTAGQVTVFGSTNATPALIGGFSAFTYNSGAARLSFTYASSTGITAGKFFGALVGNADTATLATALAANGTNCSAGSYALGVDASGNSEGCTVAALGTLTAVSIATANGFAGSSSGGTTPALTITTTISGVLKGNGSAISAASNGTDYTLLTAITCGGGQFLNAFTAAGVGTCGTPSGGGGTGVGTIATSTGSDVYQRIPFFNSTSAYPALLASINSFTFSTTSSTATLKLGQSSSAGGVQDIGALALEYQGSVSDGAITLTAQNGSSGAKAIVVPNANGTLAVSVSGSGIALDTAGNLTNTGVTSNVGTANQITVSSPTGASTFSLPSHVIFPNDFLAVLSSTTNATTTGSAYFTGVAASNLLALDSTGKLVPVTLTTSGSSGPSTFTSGTLNIPQYTGGAGAAGAQSSSTAQFVIYPSDQTSNPSTYYLFNASSTAVTSSANFQTLLAQAVSSLGGGGAYSGTGKGTGPGGGIYITPGTFYTNATTTINGSDQASTNNGPSIRIWGSGQDATKIVVVNNATFLAFDHVAVPSVSTMGIYMSGGGRGLVATSSNPNTRSIYQFNFDNLLFAATTTQNVAPINMGNILRGQFENIEFFGTHGCAVFNAEGNFNPGDFMWERTFCEMDSQSGGIALNFASSTNATGYVNQVHFTQFDAIGNGTGDTYIKANPLIWSTFDDMGVEQFDTFVDSGNGFNSVSNTYNFKYFTPRNAAGLTLFKMAAGAQGNTFTWKDSNNPQSITIISDVNGNPGAPNMISGYIGQDAGTASVSDSGGWLIIRDITGYGTMDTNLEPAGHPGVFTFIGTLLAKGSQAIADFTLAILRLPYSAAPTISTNGDTGIDSTANQLQFEAGGTQHALVDFHIMRVAMASSTWGVGTTTLYMGPAMLNMHFTAAYCETNVGTLQVSLYDGTNRSNFLNASTTRNFNTLSTNNAYTQGTSIRVDIGTAATSPTAVGCSFKYTYDIQ